MTESSPAPRPAELGPHHPLADAAREIATVLLPLTGEPALQRHVLVTLARTLREALAREHDAGPQTASTPLAVRRARALAHAIGAMPPSNEPTVLVADLRLFARLTLGECADLLNCPRGMLGRVWRATRRMIFANARAMLAAPRVVPPPLHDS